jgi:hypothetical protein
MVMNFSIEVKTFLLSIDSAEICLYLEKKLFKGNDIAPIVNCDFLELCNKLDADVIIYHSNGKEDLYNYCL